MQASGLHLHIDDHEPTQQVVVEQQVEKELLRLAGLLVGDGVSLPFLFGPEWADTDALATVPFEQNGLRDGEQLRLAMHERFVLELETCGTRWLVVAGTRVERVRAAMAACDPLVRADLLVRAAR